MLDKSISIDEGKCEKDGMCASLCPMRISTHEKKKVPTIARQTPLSPDERCQRQAPVRCLGTPANVP